MRKKKDDITFTFYIGLVTHAQLLCTLVLELKSLLESFHLIVLWIPVSHDMDPGHRPVAMFFKPEFTKKQKI